ncbi:ferredoxin--NADP reductase [Aliivibrio fischeri]|uniref:ferredoxin--NADP(+) reductase n=1 Tax=Aliivibrio fischeri TaxID=668 RepID=A0A844NZF3_ALIFS|nr:ferredoxin--NADP reductase [Aliivibrio fischeri]MUK48538.1 ferredoxin--NADP reductase [Aliivibrio fischeri]
MTEIPHGLIKGVVLKRHDWTTSLFSLFVEAPINAYQARQFTKLALSDGRGDWVRRAYSIVNNPKQADGHQRMEFLIIADQNGELSLCLQKLNSGDEIFVGKDASGFMTIDEIPKNADDLWLLSTGTAIGPFISILETPLLEMRFKNMVLVHAVRTQSELIYQERIQQLFNRYNKRFHYVPIVSREHVTGTLCGRIPTLLLSREIESRAQCQLNKTHSFLYICGNPNMVKDTSDALKELGFNKHLRRKSGQFSSENYW